MSSQYAAVTITTGATVILASNNARRGAVLHNNGSATVFIGLDSSVTTSNGMPLLQSEKLYISGDRDAWRGALYGIVASGTVEIRYIEYEN